MKAFGPDDNEDEELSRDVVDVDNLEDIGEDNEGGARRK